MFNILDLIIFLMGAHKANKHPMLDIIDMDYDSVFVTA